MRGKLSCLLINDLDAGVGHFANTQVTVNNQVPNPENPKRASDAVIGDPAVAWGIQYHALPQTLAAHIAFSTVSGRSNLDVLAGEVLASNPPTSPFARADLLACPC